MKTKQKYQSAAMFIIAAIVIILVLLYICFPANKPISYQPVVEWKTGWTAKITKIEFIGIGGNIREDSRIERVWHLDNGMTVNVNNYTYRGFAIGDIIEERHNTSGNYYYRKADKGLR